MGGALHVVEGVTPRVANATGIANPGIKPGSPAHAPSVSPLNHRRTVGRGGEGGCGEGGGAPPVERAAKWWHNPCCIGIPTAGRCHMGESLHYTHTVRYF